MKKIFIIILLLFTYTFSFAQDKLFCPEIIGTVIAYYDDEDHIKLCNYRTNIVERFLKNEIPDYYFYVKTLDGYNGGEEGGEVVVLPVIKDGMWGVIDKKGRLYEDYQWPVSEWLLVPYSANAIYFIDNNGILKKILTGHILKDSGYERYGKVLKNAYNYKYVFDYNKYGYREI